MDLLDEKEYYIAYFDILGYKDFFTHESKKQIHDIVSMIYDGISGIKSYLNRFSNFSIVPIIENIEIKFIGFSDNFTFAMRVEEGQNEIYKLLAFLSIIADIQRNFIVMYGLLVRGGIVKSTAYIGENIIQGRGIIEAVSLEHKAVYPQIIIDSSIFSDIHRLHFLTDKELEYGGSVQNKINKGLELSSDEQKFMKEIFNSYIQEQLVLTWKDNILMRSNDEKPFLNYMYNIGIINYYLEQNTLFNEFQDLLQQFNLQHSLKIPQKGDAENFIRVHKSVLIDKIKKYGSYAGVNINDASELYEREKVIKKYIWLWLYHRKLCDLYKLSEYDLQISLDIDVRVMKMVILLNDKDTKETADKIINVIQDVEE